MTITSTLGRILSLCPPGSSEAVSGSSLARHCSSVFRWRQTTINFGYVYSLKYYDNKPVDSTGHIDNTQEFNAGLTHAFSERYSLSIRDSFVIGQEPDLLRAGDTFNSFQRYSGNNDRNYGAIDFSAQLTPDFGLDLGYANTLYSYANSAPFVPRRHFPTQHRRPAK